jgi:hypothetical protein
MVYISLGNVMVVVYWEPTCGRQVEPATSLCCLGGTQVGRL